jgi:bifunctional UDP-N-acetylglucosamine pyrophosphorylase/glucosamine-1-phosphate N-acetyltransferase
MKIKAVVLAAGKGARMNSEKAKVLHEVAGIPMVNRVLVALKAAGISQSIVIVGHQAEKVKSIIGDPSVTFVDQTEQLGTGHALRQLEPILKGYDGDLLVMNGDTPLIRPETLKALVSAKREMHADAVLLTAEVKDPTGYGRVIRSVEGWVMKIVEEAEATPEDRKVREINAGVYALSTVGLFEALAKIPKSSKKGEYYITDLIGLWAAQGRRVGAMVVSDAVETLGVDTQERLRLASQYVQK